MITIRDAAREDDEAIAMVAASATATLRQTYRPNQKALSHKRTLERDLRRIVAELDGAIVGTTQYYVDGATIRLIGLAVLGKFRRRGVARALVDEVVTRTRRLGCRAVAARTVKETGNVAIFRALGFDVEAECPDEYSESPTCGPLTEVSLKMEIRAGNERR